MGHSITTWTDFCPFLTTYPPLVDKRGHLPYHPSFVHVGTHKITTLTRPIFAQSKGGIKSTMILVLPLPKCSSETIDLKGATTKNTFFCYRKRPQNINKCPCGHWTDYLPTSHGQTWTFD